MYVLLSILIVAFFGVLCVYLDVVKRLDNPSVYWYIGTMSGFIAGLIAFKGVV